jgi:hypothetical protein
MIWIEAPTNESNHKINGNFIHNYSNLLSLLMLAGVEGDVEQNLKETPAIIRFPAKIKNEKVIVLHALSPAALTSHVSFVLPTTLPRYYIFFTFERRENAQEHSIQEGRKNRFSV